MSKKRNLFQPEYPILWISGEKNGLREVVVAERFGDGDILARFWIPAETKAPLGIVLRNRLKDQFDIELGHYSRFMSSECPFDLSRLDKCVFLKR